MQMNATDSDARRESEQYLQEIAQQCKYELERLHIPIADVKEFTINTRAARRWGQCRREGSDYKININHTLLDGSHEEGLKATIMHELIHTCPQCMNHGIKWRRYAEQASAATGLKISRTNTPQEKGFSGSEMPGIKAKYVIRCPSCGMEWKRQKRSKVIKLIDRCTCGRCGAAGLTVEEVKGDKDDTD